MPVADSMLELVGNTPLVRLSRLGRDCPAEVVVKLESTDDRSEEPRIERQRVDEANVRPFRCWRTADWRIQA